MRVIPLIFSLLTLHSVACADEPRLLTGLPPEILDTIVQQIVVSQKFDFCDYVDWLAGNQWAWPLTDVGMPMLKDRVTEQESLSLTSYHESVRKRRILKNVRTFVRIRSGLPIDCTGIEIDELRKLAGNFELSYDECASLSDSSVWKKACMAGLFGRNTLIKLLPHFSKDFCSQNMYLLVQTAFFIGDIDSLKAIIKSPEMRNKNVLDTISELDIVFSNSGTFFKELVKLLPDVMTNRSYLIKEACFQNCLSILLSILEVAKQVKLEELHMLLDPLLQLKICGDGLARYGRSSDEEKLFYVLKVAAQYGHLPIIRFLWPAMKKNLYIPDVRLLRWIMGTISTEAKDTIKHMMIRAGANNRRNVIEFLLWESGRYCMKVAQLYVNDALEAAIEKGNVNFIKFLVGKSRGKKLVAPGFRLTKLSQQTLRRAIIFKKNWNGIKYLVLLKKVDPRFAQFELVDQDNTALCMACEASDSALVKYLLRRTDDGKFVFPRTNPAAQNNNPLVNACGRGNIEIVKMLLEQDEFGNYIYKGIDPSAQRYLSIMEACRNGHLNILEFLLKMDDAGEYVFPEMNGVDLSRALKETNMTYIDIVRFLLQRKDGRYLLPGMNSPNLTLALEAVLKKDRIEIAEFLLTVRDGKYIFPELKDIDFNPDLRAASVRKQIDIVKFLLRREDGKYVLPNMAGVDLIAILSTAINWNGTEIVRLLLGQDSDGSDLYPGVQVTQDMLRIPCRSPEIGALLESRLEQQRVRVEELPVAQVKNNL